MSIGNIGYTTRKTRELHVVSGSQPNNGTKASLSLPVKSGESFYSGQPLWAENPVSGTSGTIVNSDLVWTTTYSSAVPNAPVYWAFTDSAENIGTDQRLGLSSMNGIEIETPFYDMTQSYNPGDLLTAKKVTLSSAQASGNRPAGVSDTATTAVVLVTLAGYGDPVIGVVTGGMIQVKGSSSVRPRIYTEASKTEWVLQFQTSFTPGVQASLA